MAQDEKTIYVYENWRGETPTLMGRLRCSFIRGQETFSFEYDPAWLTSAESSFSLDPDLASTGDGSMCRWTSGSSGCSPTPARTAGAAC